MIACSCRASQGQAWQTNARGQQTWVVVALSHVPTQHEELRPAEQRHQPHGCKLVAELLLHRIAMSETRPWEGTFA